MTSTFVIARWWAFLPYAVVGVLHLVGLFDGVSWLSGGTKVLLMPALLLGVLVGLRTRRSEVALWGSVGILFSWAGDVLLSSPGEVGFIAGLGGFMLAHVAYLVLFLRPLRRGPIPIAALALVVWWIALLALLWPYLGSLLVPLAVYGLVLGSSTAASFGTSRIIAAGALFFLLSDTLLSFKLFVPEFAMWQSDFWIMLGYIVGQGLIGYGAVRQSNRGRLATSEPAPDQPLADVAATR